jgi:succinate dehydrogenase/fumarate reductase flavoprotein subunit
MEKELSQPPPTAPASNVYDAIVIGAGAGGMTAAAVAAALGLRVLVIEKTQYVGGTTAWSGGMVWIPVNRNMQVVGLADTRADAEQYLAATVPENDNHDLREAFLARGPEAIAFLEQHTEVRLQPVKIYPDYYPDLPGATAGGRVLEPVMYDGTRLGRHFARLRPPLPEFTLFGGMMVNRQDIPHLRRVGRSLRSTVRATKLVAAYLRQRLYSSRGTSLHLGNALAARLYASLLTRGADILFGADIEELVVEDGAVRGVRVVAGSGRCSIFARRGVVVATGGFSHDTGMRQMYFPSAAGSVSATAASGTGDGLRLGIAAGAKMGSKVADAAYWVPGSLFTRSDGNRGIFPHTVTDRAKPGVIAVNAAGRRFVNEAKSYHEFVRAMLRDGSGQDGRGFYLICDSDFLWTYGLGRIKPFTRRRQRYIDSGELFEAATIEELATAIGIEPAALASTVARYNEKASLGIDDAFGRGSNIYQRFLGDAGHGPNPCVAPIVRAPFYALPIVAADLGTAIGLCTDSNARVLNTAGEVIPGLYACGNDMHSIMNGNYPGPGITLGPALTFGYLAGRHLAQEEAAPRTTKEITP